MRSRTIRDPQAIVEEQCRKWQQRPAEQAVLLPHTMVTISREAGSQGRHVARKLAARLGYQIYGSNIIDEVAKNAHISALVVRTLDEQGQSLLEDLFASVLGDSSLTSDAYFHHLVTIIGTCAQHRGGVILGRGANFILASANTLRVRFVAPLEMRVANVMREFQLTEKEARRQVKLVGTQRQQFVRKYFGADIADPIHYDLVLNDEHVGGQMAVELLERAMGEKNSGARSADGGGALR